MSGASCGVSNDVDELVSLLLSSVEKGDATDVLNSLSGWNEESWDELS
eukprot:CAMPEP_0202449802 /NCGR_PEP_ID=MMETSP1360-20130828/8504_1 /ASSEMBLY_ACC=CAM_ASM_000848 /TAXON_ID=515479 /ORGANISM="Licmophora paradoxa, Strain CCMP2313" /LENGTH=47 /DNA_ID= /DNA_START= /DNA_END= /DNA_ORIENTATION=